MLLWKVASHVSCHFPNTRYEESNWVSFVSWLSIWLHKMCAMFELHTSEYVQFMYLIGSDTKRVSVPRYYTEKLFTLAKIYYHLF